MGYNLFSAFKLFFRKMERIFITPMMLFWRNVLRKLNPQNIVSKIATDIKSDVKGITAKPHAVKQYVEIGDRFFAKKLLLLVFLVVVFGTVLIKIRYPAARELVVHQGYVGEQLGRGRVFRKSETLHHVGMLTAAV